MNALTTTTTPQTSPADPEIGWAGDGPRMLAAALAAGQKLYRIRDSADSWYRSTDTNYPSVESILAHEEECQREHLSAEAPLAELVIFLVTGFDEEDEEEFVESIFVNYAPPVPECAGTAHDWREPDNRTGLLPVRGGSGLALTWWDQCRRCRLIRCTHHPNNLPHNGAQNSSDFYEVSYARPQYSDWRITADDDVCVDFTQDKPAEDIQEDALLARIVESHDELSADDESLVLWLIVGQDEDDEDILEERSSYWHI